jgi:hypothetical protein
MAGVAEGGNVAGVAEPEELPEAETQEPEEVEDKPDVDDAPAISKWPWQASAVAVLIVLVAMGVVIGLGWDFVISNDETGEQADYEQLLSLIDRVETVALLVLGAILGVSTTGAAARGAAAAAKKNKTEAQKQHKKAKENAEAAKKNANVAQANAAVSERNAAAARNNAEVAEQRGADASEARTDVLAATEKLQDVCSRAREGNAQVRLSEGFDDVPVVTVDEQTVPQLSRLLTSGTLRAGIGRAVLIPQESVGNSVPEDVLSEAEALVANLQQRWGE